MVFSSIAFLFYFLPLFLLAYFALPFRNAVFLVFSLIFYTLGEGPHLFLLLACVAYNHRFAILIENESARRGPGAKRWISVAIAVNLGVLGLFKYGGFLMAQLAPAIHLFGVHQLPPWPLALPFGISFFTFHALSYLIDVYRRDVKAERNLLALALYITMFPQLIAGPIVRFKTIVGELHGRRETMDGVAEGIRIFVIGLAQKTLIANTLALPADRIFALPTDMVTAPVAWIGAIAYSLQLYFDFCGYSLMAIGLARALGLHFPRNFDYPYVSKSITEFWRRWHITLSQWFRDYVYIPLGGNREGALKTYRNLIIVFFLCGLWHGAAWTFVIWGLWHGLFLVIERMGLGRVLARRPEPDRPWLCPAGGGDRLGDVPLARFPPCADLSEDHGRARPSRGDDLRRRLVPHHRCGPGLHRRLHRLAADLALAHAASGALARDRGPARLSRRGGGGRGAFGAPHALHHGAGAGHL